jgi:hypothetical protein
MMWLFFAFSLIMTPAIVIYS